MLNFETDIGKIYCKYNEEKDNYDMMRVVNIEEDGENNKIYLLRYLDENFRILDDKDKPVGESMSVEAFNNLKKDWILLKSEGLISITNVISIENEFRKIKDVIVIYFPNNKVSKVPEISQPYIVARQGINNIFDNTGSTVGMAVSIDSLPNGYTLSDFMENSSVISSRLCHVYKTDSAKDLSILLDNKETSEILKDMYEHAKPYSIVVYEEGKEIEDDCINGYCNSLKRFLEESDFMGELCIKNGIAKLYDITLEENKPLSLDDKLYIGSVYGGIRIDKAVPFKFDYTVNMSVVKMKYFLAMDNKDILYIVPYTETNNEISVDQLYNLTEERTIQLQERIAKTIKAYDESKGIKSDYASEMLKNE